MKPKPNFARRCAKMKHSRASWTAIARIQAERGDLELSCESARKALAIRPELVESYLRLAVNQHGRLADSEEQGLERLIHEPHLPADARAHLHFSLAIIRDRRERYAEAAALFDKAHELQAASRAWRGQTYEAARQSQFNERMIAAFPHGSFDPPQPRSDLTARPVFIVGLPRSGTSLIEQILASHPAVWGRRRAARPARRLPGLPQLAGRPELAPSRRSPIWTMPSPRSWLASTSIASLAGTGGRRSHRGQDARQHSAPGTDRPHPPRRSRDSLSARHPRRRRILPAGRLHRQHLDRRLAIHRAVICRLPAILAHWRLVRPVDWLEVSYEECVQELEQNARRMIEFLDLDWDPACLDFSRTRRVIRTASLAQVRQPIHDRSVGRWRRYEAWHGAMFDAFKAHGVAVDLV